MEFREFCKNFTRMCDSLCCSECEIDRMVRKNKNSINDCNGFCIDCSDQAEQIVEKWAKENPIVTNADKFREVFGFEIYINGNGYAVLDISSSVDHEEWLNQEYKEPEVEE